LIRVCFIVRHEGGHPPPFTVTEARRFIDYLRQYRTRRNHFLFVDRSGIDNPTALNVCRNGLPLWTTTLTEVCFNAAELDENHDDNDEDVLGRLIPALYNGSIRRRSLRHNNNIHRRRCGEALCVIPRLGQYSVADPLSSSLWYRQ
jgi:hypothetical protein